MTRKRTGSRLVALILAAFMLVAYMPLLGEAAYASDVTYTNTSAGMTVGDHPNNYGVTLSTDKAEYELGEDIYLKVEGSSSATAGGWIGIYDSYAVNPDTTTKAWAYTGNETVDDVTDYVIYGPNKNAGVTVNSELEGGTYYIIHMASDGRWAVLPITIKRDPSTFAIDRADRVYKSGDPINVTAKSTYPNAWVGFYPYRGGDPLDNGDLMANYKVADAASDTIDILSDDVVADKEKVQNLPDGRYKVILFTDGWGIDDTRGSLCIESFYIYNPDTLFTWYEENGEMKAYATFTDKGAIEIDAVVTADTTDATCTAAGKTVYTATVDEAAVTAAETKPGEYSWLKKATFTDTKTVEIPKKDHTPAEAVKENVVEAKCGVAGSHDEVVYCADCNAELSRTKVEDPALEHDYQEVADSAKEATCTEVGKEADKKCSHCGDVIPGAEIPKKDHTPAEAVKEDGEDASCEAAGYHFDVVKCSVCGEELSRTKVEDPALGHDYQVVEGSAKAPTFSETGKEADKKCSHCGDTIPGAEIPVLTGEASLSKTKFHYNAKVQKPAVTVTVNGEALDPQFYDVKIPSSKSVGNYTVTVTTKGDYVGFEKELKYQIAPKKVTLKLTKGTKSFTAKWAKQSATARKNIGGFQLRYSKDKSFKKGVSLSKKLSNKTVKWTKKGLKKKTKYYVEIRTYKKVNGSYIYSDWSAPKAITTK